MKKNIQKLFVFIILLFLILSINSYCLAINMNLSSDENVDLENSMEEPFNDYNEIEDNINAQDNVPAPSTNSPSVVTTSSTNDNFFTAENIISVFLIAIGIVLILLGIAILIRFK